MRGLTIITLSVAGGSGKTSGNPQTLSQVKALLKKAVSLDPQLGAGYLQLGILYADQKDFPNAIRSFRKAIEVSSRPEETVEAHYKLAQAYGRTGDKPEARKELEIYRQLSNKSSAEAQREREEIQEFVIALGDGTATHC